MKRNGHPELLLPCITKDTSGRAKAERKLSWLLQCTQKKKKMLELTEEKKEIGQTEYLATRYSKCYFTKEKNVLKKCTP